MQAEERGRSHPKRSGWAPTDFEAGLTERRPSRRSKQLDQVLRSPPILQKMDSGERASNNQAYPACLNDERDAVPLIRRHDWRSAASDQGKTPRRTLPCRPTHKISLSRRLPRLLSPNSH